MCERLFFITSYLIHLCLHWFKRGKIAAADNSKSAFLESVSKFRNRYESGVRFIFTYLPGSRAVPSTIPLLFTYTYPLYYTPTFHSTIPRLHISPLLYPYFSLYHYPLTHIPSTIPLLFTLPLPAYTYPLYFSLYHSPLTHIPSTIPPYLAFLFVILLRYL